MEDLIKKLEMSFDKCFEDANAAKARIDLAHYSFNILVKTMREEFREIHKHIESIKND